MADRWVSKRWVSRRWASRRWRAVTGCALLAGCVSGSGRGYPLHGLEPRPPSTQVVQLQGYVHYVDDVDVSKLATSFEVLPGCHLIRTPESWGKMDIAGGIIIETGEQLLALPMKGGHFYLVEVVATNISGPVGEGYLRASERDPSGEVTRTWGPVTSQADIDACRNAVEPSSGS